MKYEEFIKTKEKQVIDSGFEPTELNQNLFDWQKEAVTIALRKGRFALFEDCGLGKTLQQLEWARQVVNHTQGEVLILAPLAVIEQTKAEAEKFDICLDGITITNYEQIHNLNPKSYTGVVLDESSILKSRDGKTSKHIIDVFRDTKYKLACTATPSPNDHMELGQHSEFLGAMTYLEMLAMFFVHDSLETKKWRLRKHAIDDFWKYVCKWSLSLDNPCRIDPSQTGYDLPSIEYIEHVIPVPINDFEMFANAAVSATDLHKDLKRTRVDRIKKTAELVNKSDDQWIVWTLGNEEAKLICKEIQDAVNVEGSDKPETKAKRLNGFARKDFRVLVTKTSIASFGMNYQQCHNMVFTSYDFKFEAFYQSVRRCYRFGQQSQVNVHLMIPESQQNVRQTILEKQGKHMELITEMSKYSQDSDYKSKQNQSPKSQEVIESNYWHMNGDCVEKIKEVETNQADLIVFSPPFAELYVFSDSPNDMSNVTDYDQFKEHFSYLIPQLKRVLKPGRICSVHCMDLPTLKSRDGYIGLRRFSSMIADMFEENDMFLSSEFTVWKDPLLAAVRTKTIGLAHKQLLKDSTISRCGIADRVMCFKTKEENMVPVTKTGFTSYVPMHEHDKFPTTIKGFNEFWGYKPESIYTKEEQYSHHVWERYASPVWLDIRETDVLQASPARDKNDEKHIVPLQLPVIERIIALYSNEGETVLSPFGGIGSEGYQALKMGRKSISIELKPSYFNLNAKNHRDAVTENLQTSLF